VAYDYRVRTAYEVDDKASPKIKKMADHAGHAAKAIDGLKSVAKGAAGAFDALVSSGAKLAMLGGGAAGAGALAAIKFGLVDVNAKVEDTKLGFATIFNMLANTGIDNGLVLAQSLVEDIRKDAKELPGEFGDFVAMAQTITAPLLNAGKGMQDIRDMTRQTVVAAASLNVRFDQAAREMAMLIEGHAGGHNVLGGRLGITAHTQVKKAGGGTSEFNKATAAERIAHINALLEKGDQSLKHFGKSWSGLTSTMVDSMKQFLGRATFPLFERIKGSVEGINKLLESPKMNDLADAIGRDLVIAYDKVVDLSGWVADHWEDIKRAGIDFATTVRDLMKEVLPIAKQIAQHLGEDPKGALKSLIAMRVGAGAIGAIPNVASLGMQAASMGGKGGGAAVNSVGDYQKFLDAGVKGGFANAAGVEGGAAMGVAGAGAAAALGVALIALVGAIDVLTPNVTNTGDIFKWMQGVGQEVWRDIKDNFGAAITETTQFLKDLWVSVKPLVDLLGIALLGAIDGAIYAFRNLLAPLRAFAAAVAWALKKIGLGNNEVSSTTSNIDDGYGMDPKFKNRVLKEVDHSKVDAELAALDALAANQKAAKLKGAGKTTVNNTNYFTVMQENDPERFAVQVATYLDKVTRNPVRPTGVSTYLSK
jgi:hypothetical protein